jgi:glutaredoxin
MYHAHRYNASDAEVAAWIWRFLCVALFGFHHGGHRGHRGRTDQQFVYSLPRWERRWEPAGTKAIPTVVKLRYKLWVMDSAEWKILAAFDRPGASVLSLADLGEPAAVSSLVSQLIERGWLRAAEKPSTYMRTEDGRLQLAGPRDVTIYSRPGCHLCEEAKAQIAPLLKEFGARLTEINIDEDSQLRARYDCDVPVIFLGARMAAKHRVDLVQFRRQLRDNSS